MKRIATNSYTGWAVAILIFYWIASFVVPGVWLATGVRIALLGCGFAALREWGPAALNMLREKSSPGKSEEVLSLLGIATVSAGVVWSSVWGLLWYAHGFPAEWTATGHSMFGQYLIAIGLALVYRSTNISREVVRPVNWWAIAGLLILVGIASFFLGTRVGASQATIPWALAAGGCPVAVSSNNLAHDNASPYRPQVANRHCFDTMAEAVEAGATPYK